MTRRRRCLPSVALNCCDEVVGEQQHVAARARAAAAGRSRRPSGDRRGPRGSCRSRRTRRGSWFVAAMTRTSTAERLAPADALELVLLEHAQQLRLQRERPCRRSRRGRSCRRGVARTCRCVAAIAPVNAPRSWPNSSLSSSVSGIAAQFTATNGRSRRAAVLVDRRRDELLAGAALALGSGPPRRTSRRGRSSCRSR